MTKLTERVSAALLKLGERSPSGFAIAMDIELSTPGYLFQTYPDAWLKEYSTKGYVLQDATVAWGMTNEGSCRWSDLIGNDPAGVFDAAAAYGMRFGIVFAYLKDGKRTIASFSRPEREFSAEEASDLSAGLAELHQLLSGQEVPDLEEIRKIRAISVALSHG